MSNFSFITNDTLQSNLDVSFDHIVDLIALSESDQYKGKEVLVSSLRKTIIIHIASIIEALLLWKLKQIHSAKKIELIDDWKYSEIKILYTTTERTEIIAGLRKRETRELAKLDFMRTINLCYKHKLIKSTRLKRDIDKIREFRNRQHLGGLIEIEREYKKSDLEFCFNVAERVKRLASK